MTAPDLPLLDYDDLTVGTIESRSRTLDPPGVRALLDGHRPARQESLCI